MITVNNNRLFPQKCVRRYEGLYSVAKGGEKSTTFICYLGKVLSILFNCFTFTMAYCTWMSTPCRRFANANLSLHVG